MDCLHQKPILLTGSHRSGSTWAGKMLALSPSVGYIHEPLNPNHRPGICGAKFQFWFPYICDKNESLYIEDIYRTLCFDYRVEKEIKAITSIKDGLRFLRDVSLFSSHRTQSRRPLLKDPIALFSADWLTRRFAMDTIVLIRHPAAFAASLKKAQWFHPFTDFINQPLLMERYLEPYRATIIEQISKDKDKDIIEQSILLWNLIHYVILEYKKWNSDWIFVKHEDLSRNPLAEFQKIYKALDLKLPVFATKAIEKSTSPQTKSTTLRRDSKSNVLEWRRRLSPDEIQRVRHGTHEISKHFYTGEDWAGYQ